MTSPLSNRAGTVDESTAYVAAVLELLADSDPMEVLRTTAEKLGAIADTLGDEALHRAEAPGKWTVGEILAHLADAELVWGYRLRKVLTEDRPRLEGFDQDRWSTHLEYTAQRPEQSLSTFGVLRDQNLWLLDRVKPEALSRTYVHAKRGEETMALMIALLAGHDLAHLRQIDRIMAARHS